jgi:hypothetical protein
MAPIMDWLCPEPPYQLHAQAGSSSNLQGSTECNFFGPTVFRINWEKSPTMNLDEVVGEIV